jgi:excisionase family DNA binding protein
MGALRPIEEVAQDHGVSSDTLYRLLRRGVLSRYRRTGDRRTYLDEEEVRKALGFRKIEPPTT